MGLGLTARLGTSGSRIFRTFDLFANFDVANIIFSNEDVLGFSQGVQAGEMAVVKTGGTGSVKVVSGELELVGSGNWDETGIKETDGITKALGKAFFVTTTLVAGIETEIGVNIVAGMTRANSMNFRAIAGSSLSAVSDIAEAAVVIVGENLSTAEHKFLVLQGGFNASGLPWYSGQDPANYTRGIRYLLKGGTFSDYTLVWVAPSDNTNILYPIVQQKHAQALTYDNIYIPPNPLPVSTMFNPAYIDTSPDTSVNDITISDALIDTNITMPGAGTDTFQIRFRYQDPLNFWNVNLIAGTAGTDLTLHKTKPAGGEGAAVASADCDFTPGATIDIRIICRGSTWFNVYIDGELKLEYTGPDTEFEDETEVQLVNGGAAFTINTFTAHRSTYSAWDDAIAAATGGTY